MENVNEKAFWYISFGILFVAIVLSLIDRARVVSAILIVLLVVIYAFYRIGGISNGDKNRRKEIQSDQENN